MSKLAEIETAEEIWAQSDAIDKAILRHKREEEEKLKELLAIEESFQISKEKKEKEKMEKEKEFNELLNKSIDAIIEPSKTEEEKTMEEVIAENPTLETENVAAILTELIANDLSHKFSCATIPDQNFLFLAQMDSRQRMEKVDKFTYLGPIFSSLARNGGTFFDLHALQPYEEVMNSSGEKMEQKVYKLLFFHPTLDVKLKKEGILELQLFFSKFIQTQDASQNTIEFGAILKALQVAIKEKYPVAQFGYFDPHSKKRWIFQFQNAHLFIYVVQDRTPNSVREKGIISQWVSSIYPVFMEIIGNVSYFTFTPEQIESIAKENLDEDYPTTPLEGEQV